MKADIYTKKRSNRVVCRRWISCMLIPIMILFTACPCFANETVSATARSKFYDLKSEILVNPFKYSGYYKDPESQMYYLNARYYSPELMRFISKDTYDLSNRYAYCEGNPISSIDPSGHMSKGWASAIGFGASLVLGIGLGIAIPGAGSIAGAAGVGLVSSAIGNIVEQGASNEDFNKGQLAGAAIIGAVAGGAMAAAGKAINSGLKSIAYTNRLTSAKLTPEELALATRNYNSIKGAKWDQVWDLASPQTFSPNSPEAMPVSFEQAGKTWIRDLDLKSFKLEGSWTSMATTSGPKFRIASYNPTNNKLIGDNLINAFSEGNGQITNLRSLVCGIAQRNPHKTIATDILNRRGVSDLKVHSRIVKTLQKKLV